MSATTEPQLRRWSSYASLSVAVLLVIAKASAWFVTDSLSLLASLVDAVVDVTAALVTVLGVHYAARPADAMHRFGHGKAEVAGGVDSGAAACRRGKRSDLRRTPSTHHAAGCGPIERGLRCHCWQYAADGSIGAIRKLCDEADSITRHRSGSIASSVRRCGQCGGVTGLGSDQIDGMAALRSSLCNCHRHFLWMERLQDRKVRGRYAFGS